MSTTIRQIFTTAAAAAAAVGAVTVGVPASAALAAPAEPCVQNVAVINNGAYSVSFTVTNRIGISSTPTDSFLINEYRLVDLTATPIPAGDDVRPVIDVSGGNTVPSADFVSYCANGQTATYSATGTTLDPQVTLVR